MEPGRRILTDHVVTSLATADFDKDGIVDVAAYCSVSQYVLILKGLGNGAFQAGASLAINVDDSRGLAVADFNADGIPDLAAAQFNGVALFLGNGDGTFRPAVEMATWGAVVSILAADLDGNGAPDLVVAMSTNQNIAILKNDQGQFQRAVSVSLDAGYIRGLAAADLNGDGKLDIAAAGDDGVAVLLGVGDGAFQKGSFFPDQSRPLSLALGDLNQDGITDAVTGNYYGGRISALLGKGDGSFTAAGRVTAIGDVFGVTLADLDGDGKLDIAASSYNSGSALVAIGRANGQFGSPVYFGGESRAILRAADVDGDGNQELAVFVLARKSLFLLRQGVSLISSICLEDYPVDVQSADFNSDGAADLLVLSFGSTIAGVGDELEVAVTLLSGRPGGGLQTLVKVASLPSKVTTSATAPTLAVGDFTGDSNPDFVVANGITGSLQLFRGNGNGGFTAAAEVPGFRVAAVTSADFDGDRLQDLAGATSTGVSLISVSAAGGFTPRRSVAACTPALSLLRGDFNGDSRPDLVVVCRGGVSIFFNSGGGDFQAMPQFTVGSSKVDIVSATVADFDGDRKDDLFISQALNDLWGSGTLLLSRGDRAFLVASTIPVPPAANALSAGRWGAAGRMALAVFSMQEANVTIVQPSMPGVR
ncbi:MAG: VCBS repeat-containing protein [Acidobacteria bacterium]|nr:VCBS repeat-containing protein [Acidobacteriota bacterium]